MLVLLPTCQTCCKNETSMYESRNIRYFYAPFFFLISPFILLGFGNGGQGKRHSWSAILNRISILILRGLKKIPIPRRQQRIPFAGDPLRSKLPLGRQQTFESPADSPLLITQRGPSNFIEGLTPDIFLEKQVRGRWSDKRSR